MATAVACALVAAGTSGASLTRSHAAAPSVRGGFAVVQYAATSPAPLPWNAHLLSGADPTLTASGAPRAAPDAQGGTQVTFRNPKGDVIWLIGSRVGQFAAVNLTRATGVAPLLGEPVPAVSAAGLDQVFCVTRNGHLVRLSLDPYHRVPLRNAPNLPLQPWWRTDLTALGGPPVVGTPSVVTTGSTTAVFARARSGDLIQYVNDGHGGASWSAYDLSVISAGPKLASDPSAFFDPTSHQLRVAATELAPTRGDVVVFTPSDVGGRVWTFQDVTKVAHTSPASAGVAAVVLSGSPALYAAGPNGDLVQYLGTDTPSTTTWKTTDLTTTVPGSPPIAGTPSAAVLGSRVAVAGVAASWGDLFVWSNTAVKGAFVATDVSITGAGPSRTVAGTPAAVFQSGVLSLYAAGVAVPAPEGTGVYAIPWTKWPQALKDGWPILGVTGGLGAQCAPWTSYTNIGSSTPPDEYVGQTIQASHLRATWLSFWTVSGPHTAPGPGCGAEKGPVTAQTFYAHGVAAGAWVATQIDAYRATGLGLKPDWVIFDPEGYPDNHSGLWGPTAPPAKLHQSVADWYAMLAGWHAGIVSVDPSLKAALYANQYEYMTYRLFNQPLPTFIAGAFSQKLVKGKKVFVVPSRTAFGSNIRGFVMYNTFNPTCAQVNNERLLLTQIPWTGAYNTLQTPPGTYCAPGPTPPT